MPGCEWKIYLGEYLLVKRRKDLFVLRDNHMAVWLNLHQKMSLKELSKKSGITADKCKKILKDFMEQDLVKTSGVLKRI